MRVQVVSTVVDASMMIIISIYRSIMSFRAFSFCVCVAVVSISRCTAFNFFVGSSIRVSTIRSSSKENDDDELIKLIRGPLGAERPRIKPRAVMILSDGTGLTAKSAIEKTIASQFNGCDERFLGVKLSDDDNDDDDNCEAMSTKLFPFIKSEKEVADIVKKAEDFNSL
jgi:hypothetical protein